MNEERKSLKENSLETKQTDFRKRENKEAGNNRKDNRREKRHNVRHVTYDRRQVNNPRSPYRPRATQRQMGQIFIGRTESIPPNRRQLNPQVSEFDLTVRSPSLDSNSEPGNMTGNESQLMKN